MTIRTRYGLACKWQSGLYGWAHANQGRFFFDTREAAEAWLEAARVNTPHAVEGWFVKEARCYAHGDAIAAVWG